MRRVEVRAVDAGTLRGTCRGEERVGPWDLGGYWAGDEMVEKGVALQRMNQGRLPR